MQFTAYLHMSQIWQYLKAMELLRRGGEKLYFFRVISSFDEKAS